MDETPGTTAQELPDFFVSRAGIDAPFADAIGRILEGAGHAVVLQQWDFANRNFMERMHAALSSGARVIALLSNAYLTSEHCEAEWLNAIADDPLNTRARLIVLRVGECTPRGLLTALAYWDLVPIRDDLALVRDVVLTATKPGRHKDGDGGEGTLSATYWRAARPVVHPEIRPTAGFTGRAEELLKIGQALAPTGDAAAASTPVVVCGLGGVGKSTLVREYAHRVQDAHAGVWWLSAARTPGSKRWDGIERGLVELGSLFIRGLDQAEDRAKAARRTLEFLAHGGFAKPWLLVYDSADDGTVLRDWAAGTNVRVVVTTRIAATAWRAAGVADIDVEEWALPEAEAYLVAASGRRDLTAAGVAAVATELGRLPLALSHAAAYLRENDNATAESYLASVSRHMRRAPESAEYDRAVFATFQQQAEQVEARVPGARAVLSLAAFYAPTDIPEELFDQGAQSYPPAFGPLAADPVALEQAIGILNRYSLVDFAAGSRTFSLHRLVQAAARDALAGEAATWAQGALRAAAAAFPEPTFDTWPACERLILHVRAAAVQGTADRRDVAELFVNAGSYLEERGAVADVLTLCRSGLAMAERLAKADPGQADLQGLLSVAHGKVGDALAARGDLAAALDHYKASVEGLEPFATADPTNIDWQRVIAVSQANIARGLVAQGDLRAGLARYRTALAILEQLAKAAPDDQSWQRTLPIVQSGIGRVLVAQGDLPAALASYNAAFAISDRQAKAHPADAGLQRSLAVRHNEIGDVLVAQGNYPAAFDRHAAALALFDQLASSHPGSARWRRDVALAHSKVGNILIAQGRLVDARESYEASLAIIDRLAKADPENAGWQHELAVCHGSIGDALGALNDPPAALANYKTAVAILERLTKAYPRNADWQRDLAACYGAMGATLVAQGEHADALDRYQSSATVLQRLADSDPGNADWQAVLASTHSRIGDVLAALRDPQAAVFSYTAAWGIIDPLARSDPGNADWQRMLFDCHRKIGDIQGGLRNLPIALACYMAALAVIDRLAQAHPGNARWQQDLAISHLKVGDALAAQGDLPAAHDSFRASLAISDRLAASDRGNPDLQCDLSICHGRIGDVHDALEDAPAALASYGTSLEIMQRVVEALPAKAEYERHMAMMHARIAAVETRRGDRDAALKALRAGREILARLTARAPDDDSLQQNLAVFESRIAALEQ